MPYPRFKISASSELCNTSSNYFLDIFVSIIFSHGHPDLFKDACDLRLQYTNQSLVSLILRLRNKIIIVFGNLTQILIIESNLKLNDGFWRSFLIRIE